MPYVIGANPSLTYTATEIQQSGKGFSVNDRMVDQSGAEWLFVLAGVGGLTASYVAIVDEAGGAIMVTSTNGAYGDRAGVPLVAIAASSYGWVQIYGACAAVQVSASCAANVRINTTATAGQLDDDGTSGAEPLLGLALTTARAASAGTAPAFLSYPLFGTTL